LNPQSIEIRDLRGHKVADWSQEALVGKTSVVWMGRNSSGGAVPGGVYVVRVRTASQVVSASVALP
jgi:flagellar hook assembly protein FlgD